MSDEDDTGGRTFLGPYSPENEKVIRPKFGDPKLVIDDTGAFCMHEFLRLQKRDQSVWCRMCKMEVDAFDVLTKLSREWDWATHFHQKKQELQAQLEELKKEEQLVKARIKNARKGSPEPKSTLYFEEWLRRLEAAQTYSEWSDVGGWAAKFKWLTPEQESAIREANFRAKQRCEANGRKRGRHVKVIKGGKVT